MSFQSEIIKWYHHNKRDLPWRHTRDPYLIWLSEIILQQTRVEQGMDYYLKFSETYKNITTLANASEEEILKMWQGLGYYSRARNLHAAAKDVTQNHSGKFPSTYEQIKSLKGIGDYTAAAISSFAFDLPHAVVDGNVYRLLSRYFGIETPIDSSAGKKEFTLLADELIKDFPPAVFNQAMMEFGARQCKYSNPLCETCPVINSCFAFNNNKITVLPVKKNKTKVRERFFHYLIIRNKNSFFIKKRIEKDIWQGLHDFPLIETKSDTKENVILKSAEWKKYFGKNKIEILKISDNVRHILSHQTIHARFYEIADHNNIFQETSQEYKMVNSDSVKKFAVPKLIESYLRALDVKTQKSKKL